MIHVAVVSNDNCVVEEIEVALLQCFQKNEYIQDNYCDETEFTKELKKINKYDAVFIDMDFHRKECEHMISSIRKIDIDEKIKIVLISSRTDDLSSLFIYHPFDFMEKPASGNKIAETVNKMGLCEDIVILTVNRKKRKILINDIKYIQSDAHKIKIYLNDVTEPLSCYMKLGDIYDIIKAYNCNFIRVHASYIVNKNYIDDYKGIAIRISNDIIPVSRRFYRELRKG